MFGIFATIKIKPDQHEQFLITIRETARRSVESEPGCLRLRCLSGLS
jgi:quinol monooxygenase YgiN